MRYQSQQYRQRRKQAIVRDQARCISCSWTEARESAKQLHVHHVVPRRLFNSDDTADSAANLVCLCSMCHGSWERAFSTLKQGVTGRQDEYCKSIVCWMKRQEAFYRDQAPQLFAELCEEFTA